MELSDVLLFIAIGFIAQVIDGAAGMAYGVTASTLLATSGVPPATTSACVHAAEVFTTGASGFAHWRLGNVRTDLIWRLAVPGMVGGAIGAYVLTALPGDMLRPFISAYLLAMGLLILWKATRKQVPDAEPPKRVGLLGLGGGFLDAIGGGGWGPMVASTLIGQGTTPRYAIGSVNLAEFFVTAVITGTFVLTIGLTLWPVIAGLIIGGILAAPLAAYVTKQLPNRPMMILIGLIVVLLSLRGLVQAFL
jgi:uncharacterized membrane protein YfcA